MKRLIVIFILYLTRGFDFLSSSNPIEGYCRYQGVTIKEGTSVPGPLGDCIQLTCLKATLITQELSSQSCPEFTLGSGCFRTKVDYSKPYPECCSKSVCNNLDSNNIVYS